jgi:hypothetical protein
MYSVDLFKVDVFAAAKPGTQPPTRTYRPLEPTDFIAEPRYSLVYATAHPDWLQTHHWTPAQSRLPLFLPLFVPAAFLFFVLFPQLQDHRGFPALLKCVSHLQPLFCHSKLPST